MNQELSFYQSQNDICFIVFFDKTYKQITKKQADYIMQTSASDNKFVKLPDGTAIAFSSICKILNEKEFYEQYPENKPIIPEDASKTTEEINQMRRDYKYSDNSLAANMERSAYFREQIIKGLEKYIARTGSKNAQKLIDDIKKCITKKDYADTIFNSISKKSV